VPAPNWSINASAGYQGPTNASYFGPTAGAVSLPTSPASDYKGAYSNAVNLNKQLYENIQGGYAQMLQQFQRAQAGLNAGWSGLETQVMRRLSGKNRANIRDIGVKYADLTGRANQQLIDRGLGNTTVQQAVTRGLAADQTAEVTRSREGYSRLLADAQSNLGGQRLGAVERGMGMLSGIQGRTLDWMNSIAAPYPDPGLYAQLAQMEAQGRMPGSLPGMPGPSRGSAPTGGYGPQGGAFYAHGGGFDAGPMSGASLQSYANFAPAPVQPYGYASAGYSDPWVSASKDVYGGMDYGYGGAPQQAADYSAMYAQMDPMY
jgi:hypothetical protein